MPTNEEIIALHKKYAPSMAAFERVYGHCQIIWEIAQQLLSQRSQPVDTDVVRAGCLLHDIGVYRLYDDGVLQGEKYIQHDILGEEILRSEGYPEVLYRIASHHTGTGLTKEDIQQQGLPLPLADYTAATIEERLVMYADKFHSKTEPPQLNSVRWYRHHIGQFGARKINEFDALVREFGEPDLAPFATKYKMVIR